DGGRREGKFIGSAITQLEVDLLAAGLRRGEGHESDELAWLQKGFPLRRASRKDKEVSNRDLALPARTLNMNGGFESGEGDVHVRGVGGDAVFAGAQDGESAVVALNGGTARTGDALVAS